MPVSAHPQWQSFTTTDAINELMILDNYLWIGSDGGLIVQALGSGEIAHFKSEHGLASNRVTALAEGTDRSLWVGTQSGGVSNFNGRIWTTFTTDEGLSNNQINDVTVTSDGAIWVATPNGLDRYDGERWTNFNAINTVFALRSQNVRHVITVPGSDQIWAATDRGLIFFDGRNWENVTFGQGDLGSDNVLDIDFTSNGALWIGHQAGLQRFQNGIWTKIAQQDGLLDPEVHWVTAVSETEVWLGYREDIGAVSQMTLQNGVPVFTHWDTAVHFENATLNTVLQAGSVPLLGTTKGLYQLNGTEWQLIQLPSDIPSHQVNDIVGARGAVWSSGAFGIGRYDGANWQFFDQSDGLISQEVHHLTIGPDQTPYAAYGVAGMGLSQFRSNGSWESIECPTSAPHSMNIFDGLEDQNGRYWFVSDRGLARYDESGWEIFTPFHGLPDGRLWDVDEAPDGTIWVAGQFGFAFQSGDSWEHIPKEDAQQVTVSPNGTVWGVTIEEVLKLEGSTATVISPVPSPHVGTIDATSEALWMATADGVARLDAQTLSWFSYSIGEGLPFNRTPVVTVDEQEQVWAISESGPREPTNGYFIPYNFNLRYVSKLVNNRWEPTLIADKNRPLHGIIMDMLEDDNGDIWVGTLAGVSRFDGTSWRSYTMANGLLAPEVFKLAEGFGGVWIVTQNGIVQLIEDGQNNITTHNRLVWNGDAFLRLDIEIAPDGTLWASNGINLYQFNGTEWREFAVDQSLGISRIDSLTFDNNGRLWAGMSLQGDLLQDAQRIFLGVFENNQWRWQAVRSLSQPQPNSLNELAFDSDGRLWGASTNGAWRFDINRPNFGEATFGFRAPIEQITDIDFTPEGATILPSRFSNNLITVQDDEVELALVPIPNATGIHSTLSASDGAVWVGANQGLARFKNEEWTVFPAQTFQTEGTSTWLTPLSNNQFWIGTSQGQIITFEDGAVSQLPLFTDSRSIERPFAITSIFPQADDGVLIGSVLGGVAQYNSSSGWHRFGSSASLYDGILQDIAFQGTTAWFATSEGVVTRDVFSEEPCFVNQEAEWQNAKLVFPTVNNELWFLDGQVVYWLDDGQLGRGGYQALPVGTTGLDGSVWFSTPNGLMRHGNGRSRQLFSDLPTESPINSLTVDNNNRLWMGTQEGAFIFDLRNWDTLQAKDGLADNQINQISFAPDGTIWFITAGGLSRYQP